MWKKFEEKEKLLFQFCNGKQVCLWGYGYTGRFCEHLFKRKNKKIEYLIDDAALDLKIDVERSFILKEFDKDTHVVLLAFSRDDNAVSYLEQLGYRENKNYIFVRELFYGDTKENRRLSYHDWLEYEFQLDILAQKAVEDMEKPNDDSFYYSAGIDYSLVDVLDNFAFEEDSAVFDFGCGKGGALLLFYSANVSKLGGVEYDEEIYDIAVDNFKKMGIDTSGVLHADAAKVTKELDQYNYFFMYNPFQGETFRQVIKNLQDSYMRKNRTMYLIYSGPYNHDLVIKDGIFKHSKTIKTDYAVKNVRIYCTR